ncbi:MAG: efflux RND transporter permease subunit [Verrucomicrobiota bacterium]|nr:efflux RND transporter permease subunit [Verrucomicrobiota bacterium]|tara:strand:- start:1167 stop:4424 length:3258 start_codon:yes stop_codon:yes gene_type:complete
MRNLIKWFSRNNVAANFIMALVLLAGISTWLKLKKEIFPETSTNVVSVSIPYPGATPEEVEKGVCIPIEEALRDLQGIDVMRSTAANSYGVVYVEVSGDSEVRDVLDDMKTRVDAIDNFAENIESPVYEEVLIKNQVLTVAISADANEQTLRGYADRIRNGMLSYVPKKPDNWLDKFISSFSGEAGVSQVELTGIRPYEISIELSEDAMNAYGVSFDDVATAVRASSIDLPGGAVRTEAGEILIKTESKRYSAEQFEGIAVISRADGTVVPLSSIANVIDGFEDVDLTSRFNGKNAATLQVFRVGNEDTLKVANAAISYLQSIRNDLPADVSIEIWNDNSKYLKGRLNLLKKNAIWGLILVLIILSLFLRPSLAALVTLGIPVSFTGAIWMMPYTDISINMITLFAFILVLGIVVDDAIVVGENVFKRMRAGECPKLASWRGTHEVGIVVIFGVLTTAAAFTPMLGISGVSGKIWRNIPWIVIPTLLFSLVQSKLILPAHLALLKPIKPNEKQNIILRFQSKVSDGMEIFVDRIYRPTLKLALQGRYIVVTVFVSLFLISVGLIVGERIKWEFFPEVEAEIISTKVKMIEGVAFESTSEAVLKIEEAAKKLDQNYREKYGEPLIKNMLATVGSQPFKTGFSPITPTGDNLGEVAIEILPGSDRSVTARELAAEWRVITGSIPAASEVSFQSQSAGSGNAIDLELSGDNMEDLLEATELVKRKLSEIEGIIDISDSNVLGKRQVSLKSLLPEGESTGLRLSDVGKQMRQAFYGEEVQRLQRGRDEVKVMVRYPKKNRLSIDDVETMKIRTKGGNKVPLSSLVELEEGRSKSVIRRTERLRAIRIAADIDRGNPNANANQARRNLENNMLSEFGELYPGIKYEFYGEQKDQAQSMEELQTSSLFALLVVFVLMAIPLGSYIQPGIVMSVIPFGIVGAIIGHILMGANISIMSMCGIVALSGVVVNDSLVLVDYVNRHRIRGKSIVEAAWEAGAARFRPIVLTSLTTFAGLSPMLFETDLQAKFLIPMAISLGFGILFATFITLILVPCVYLLLEDLKSLIFKPEKIRNWEDKFRSQGLERLASYDDN